MSVPFLTKYEPASIDDIVFASEYNKQIIDLYAAGQKHGHLLLWGSQGSGKSSIASLLPKTIEQTDFTLHKIHASKIKNINELLKHMESLRDWSRFYGGRFNRYYLVVEELAFSHDNCSRFWTEIERIQSDSMVIITTNEPMKVDRSIRSRCECLEIQPASASQFLARAKWIVNQEGFDIDDANLLKVLLEVENLRDNRKYLQRLETVIGLQRVAMEKAAVLDNSEGVSHG